MSDDIDYFTPQEYGTVDFESMYLMLRNEFDYIDAHGSNIGFGNSYYETRYTFIFTTHFPFRFPFSL